MNLSSTLLICWLKEILRCRQINKKSNSNRNSPSCIFHKSITDRCIGNGQFPKKTCFKIPASSSSSRKMSELLSENEVCLISTGKQKGQSAQWVNSNAVYCQPLPTMHSAFPIFPCLSGIPQCC